VVVKPRRGGNGFGGPVAGLVAEHRVQDVAPAAGQADQRGVVLLPLIAFPLVVGPAGWVGQGSLPGVPTPAVSGVGHIGGHKTPLKRRELAINDRTRDAVSAGIVPFPLVAKQRLYVPLQRLTAR
jgi:hypothetical protein